MLINIYDVCNLLEQSFQQLLHCDITEHSTKTAVNNNKNWLAVHAVSFVKLSIKRAKAKAIQGIKLIKQYLGTREQAGTQGRHNSHYWYTVVATNVYLCGSSVVYSEHRSSM